MAAAGGLLGDGEAEEEGDEGDGSRRELNGYIGANSIPAGC